MKRLLTLVLLILVSFSFAKEADTGMAKPGTFTNIDGMDNIVSYDFEDGVQGWTVGGTANSQWSHGVFPHYDNTTPAIWIDSDAAGSGNTCEDVAIAPIMDLSMYSAVAFNADVAYRDLGDPSLFLVYRINGGDWVQAHEFVAQQAWVTEEVILPAEALVADVEIGMYYTDNAAWDWYAAFDNVVISEYADTEPPVITAISGLTVPTDEDAVVTVTFEDASTIASVTGTYDIGAGPVALNWSPVVTDNTNKNADAYVSPKGMYTYASDAIPGQASGTTAALSITAEDSEGNSDTFDMYEVMWMNMPSWDIAYEYDVQTAHGVVSTAGCETDGSIFLTAKWNGTEIHKFDMDGTFIETFTISIQGTRDMAYDGQYFWGAPATGALHGIDAATNAIASNISTAGAYRAIAYDSDQGGFLGNNWSGDVNCYDYTGTLLYTITDPGIASAYGMAYDNVGEGGPFLWTFEQNGGTGDVQTIRQIDITTGMYTGIEHDVDDLPVMPTDAIAGGLFFYQDADENWILSGTLQGDPVQLFGYVLYEAQGGEMDPPVLASLNGNNAAADEDMVLTATFEDESGIGAISGTYDIGAGPVALNWSPAPVKDAGKNVDAAATPKDSYIYMSDAIPGQAGGTTGTVTIDVEDTLGNGTQYTDDISWTEQMEPWDIVYFWDAQTPSGMPSHAGIETDGEYFLTSKWNGSEIHKFDFDGNYIETFTVSIAGTRDLAYDDEYFWGAPASGALHGIDVATNSIVANVSTAGAYRAIAFDSDNGGFLGNNWTGDITCYDYTGTLLYTIADPGVQSAYGMAFDNIGGNFLWTFEQNGGTGDVQTIRQIDIDTGQYTGVEHNVDDLPTMPTDGIAGGLCFHIYGGYWVLGGMMQGEPNHAFGYALYPAEDTQAPALTNLAGNQGYLNYDLEIEATFSEQNEIASIEGWYDIGAGAVSFDLTSAKASYLYTGTIPAQSSPTTGTVWFDVEDNMGNSGTTEPQPIEWMADANAPEIVAVAGTAAGVGQVMTVTLTLMDEIDIDPATVYATYQLEGGSPVNVQMTMTRNTTRMFTVDIDPQTSDEITGTIFFDFADVVGNSATSDDYDLSWQVAPDEYFYDLNDDIQGWTIGNIINTHWYWGIFPHYPENTTNSFWIDSDAAGSAAGNIVDWAISPVVNTAPWSTGQLQFEYAYRDLGDPSMSVHYRVAGGDWVQLEVLPTQEFWGPYTITLPAEALHAELEVGILYDDLGAWDWYAAIDDIRLVNLGNDTTPPAFVSLNGTTAGPDMAMNLSLTLEDLSPMGDVTGTYDIGAGPVNMTWTAAVPNENSDAPAPKRATYTYTSTIPAQAGGTTGTVSISAEDTHGNSITYPDQNIEWLTGLTPWTVVKEVDVETPHAMPSTAGVEFDGTNYLTTKWNGSEVHKFDAAGNYIETFTISVAGTRDMAYDGQYFWGAPASGAIHGIDASTNSIASNISTAGAYRAIAFDEDNGGFLGNNWSGDITCYDYSGTLLYTIADPGIASAYGMAYDNMTAGDPVLWTFEQNNGTGDVQTIRQIDINTGQYTGVEHNVDDLTNPPADGIAGGLYFYVNNGAAYLGGVMQGTPCTLFEYYLETGIGGEVTPSQATLYQNYPNPFNPSTSIKFYNAAAGNVKLTVYNAKGEVVKSLVNGEMAKGMHTLNFDAVGLNSGVYFYTIKAPGLTQTKKMIMVK